MIIERIEHPGWLSNAYLVADRAGGHGVLIDSNGLEGSLIDRARAADITITHVLLTHAHPDHVVDAAENARDLGVPLVASALTATLTGGVTRIVADGEEIASGDLRLRAVATPGHCQDHVAFVCGDHCFTADCIFKGTVGGTANGGPNGFAELKHSIMDVVLALPAGTTLHPGHREPTTVADELEGNPFVRIWRGVDPEGSESCRARGDAVALILLGPDYDGTHKAWIRYPDGTDKIVGGSWIER